MSDPRFPEGASRSRQHVAETSSQQRRFVLARWLAFAGAVLLALATLYYLLTYNTTGRSPTVRAGVAALLGITGLTAAWWLVRHKKLEMRTIRVRLLLGFVLIASLPAIAISTGSSVVGYYNGRQQTLDRLESVVARKELEIWTWIHSLQNELVIALNDEYALDRARVVLDLAREDKYYIFFNKAMRYRFQWFVEQSEQLEELFLLDLRGRVALSTNVSQEGRIYFGETLFQQGLTGSYAQLPFSPGSQDGTSVIAVIPVVTGEGQVLGLLAGRTNTQPLIRILREQTGLGKTGKTYLVNSNHLLLTEAYLSTMVGLERPGEEQHNVHTVGSDAPMDSQASGSAVYEDYRGVPVVGAYRWLPELQVTLLVEQDASEAFRSVNTILGVNVSIALAFVLLAVVASLAITRSITTPLVELVSTATQIAAGDLEHVAEVDREDEVGALAQAFNSMTAQLRSLISGLEERVAERTQAVQEANLALQRRALQLETSAQVSREITSILYIDDLLRRVVELIREAFGYYHVHVFLMDSETDRLRLRASSGAVSPQFQWLEIGSGSLNGEAAQANEALLANDVAQDPRYLADEHAPDTQSELVVPLRVGDQVLGTLDVQSAEVNAFTQEDVLVIQSLGDQIAIAIENARLYDRSRELAVLEERQRLARELHDSVTQSLFSLDLHAKAIATHLKREPQQAEAQIPQLRQITHDALREMRSLIFGLRPTPLKDIGLVPTLRQHIEHLRRPDGPEIVLQATGEHRLSDDVEQDVLRIAQEALGNAIKHARARRIVVELTMDSERLVLRVADDGQGFDPTSFLDGQRAFGLSGIRERTESLNGSFEIVSHPGAGTQVSVRVPIQKKRKPWHRSAS